MREIDGFCEYGGRGEGGKEVSPPRPTNPDPGGPKAIPPHKGGSCSGPSGILVDRPGGDKTRLQLESAIIVMEVIIVPYVCVYVVPRIYP